MTGSSLFSPQDYVALTKEFLAKGYLVVDYDSVVADARHLIIRHDVDFCLQRATEMAKIETEIGVSATYFILLSSEFYNLFTPQSQRSLREILDGGHKIGLHFDPTVYDDLEWGVKKEKQALEMMIKEDVTIMSFHRPHQEWLNSSYRISNLPHTYEPRYFSEIAYVSDSRGDWHHGHPFDHAAVEAGRAMQLLTHPIWWMHNYGENYTPTKALSGFADYKNVSIHKEIAGNCASYQPSDERMNT